MRSISRPVLLALIAGTASAQDTRSLDPWAARIRWEALAGRADRSTVVLTTLRREMRSVTVGAALGWLNNRPAVRTRFASGGSRTNFWNGYWQQSGEQRFVMVGPLVDGAMPIGAYRIESRFSLGLMPWAYGKHRAQNFTRCTYSGPPTCTTQPDSTVFDGSQSGRYGLIGLGIRAGDVLVYWSAIWVTNAKEAIQGQRLYWPISIGVRF